MLKKAFVIFFKNKNLNLIRDKLMKTNVIKFELNRYKEDIDYILLEKAYTE